MSRHLSATDQDAKKEIIVENLRCENLSLRGYGKGVRQENVRSKTKELTGTLPYVPTMHHSLIGRTPRRNNSLPNSGCQCYTAWQNCAGSNRLITIVRIVIAVRHDRRREISPFWLAVLLEDVQTEVYDGKF